MAYTLFFIIATHGNIAEGLKDAVSLVVGEQENLECIGLRHEDSIDTFIENVKELAQRTENDVLVLLQDFHVLQ